MTDKAVEAVARQLAGMSDERWNACDTSHQDVFRDGARIIIAAYEAALWQPIETAPRDGTLVIVRTNSVEGLPAFITCCAYHPDAGWCVDELREPTKWRPLPRD